jgi:hypothetical protein
MANLDYDMKSIKVQEPADTFSLNDMNFHLSSFGISVINYRDFVQEESDASSLSP